MTTQELIKSAENLGLKYLPNEYYGVTIKTDLNKYGSDLQYKYFGSIAYKSSRNSTSSGFTDSPDSLLENLEHLLIIEIKEKNITNKDLIL